MAQKGDIDVLFMGDSITDFWRNADGPYAGKPVLDKYFGHMKVANFGIAGDTTQGVLYRLQHGEGQGFSPSRHAHDRHQWHGRNTAEIAGISAVVPELRRVFRRPKSSLAYFREARPMIGSLTIAEINPSS